MSTAAACLAPSSGIAPDASRALRVGFSYLQQMGDRSLDRLKEKRRHGPFSSFEDFYLRTRIDYPVAENLIRVGAFDSLEPDRTELLWILPLLHDRLEALSGSSGGRRGQLRAFFSPPMWDEYFATKLRGVHRTKGGGWRIRPDLAARYTRSPDSQPTSYPMAR